MNIYNIYIMYIIYKHIYIYLYIYKHINIYALLWLLYWHVITKQYNIITRQYNQKNWRWKQILLQWKLLETTIIKITSRLSIESYSKYPKKYSKTKHLNYLFLSTATLSKEENRYYVDQKTLVNVLWH